MNPSDSPDSFIFQAATKARWHWWGAPVTVELSSGECMEQVTLEDLKIDAPLLLANYILKSPTYKGDRNLVSMAMMLQVQCDCILQRMQLLGEKFGIVASSKGEVLVSPFVGRP